MDRLRCNVVSDRRMLIDEMWRLETKPNELKHNEKKHKLLAGYFSLPSPQTIDMILPRGEINAIVTSQYQRSISVTPKKWGARILVDWLPPCKEDLDWKDPDYYGLAKGDARRLEREAERAMEELPSRDVMGAFRFVAIMPSYLDKSGGRQPGIKDRSTVLDDLKSRTTTKCGDRADLLEFLLRYMGIPARSVPTKTYIRGHASEREIVVERSITAYYISRWRSLDVNTIPAEWNVYFPFSPAVVMDGVTRDMVARRN